VLTELLARYLSHLIFTQLAAELRYNISWQPVKARPGERKKREE